MLLTSKSREGRCSGLVTVEAIEGSEACDVYWEVGIARAAGIVPSGA